MRHLDGPHVGHRRAELAHGARYPAIAVERRAIDDDAGLRTQRRHQLGLDAAALHEGQSHDTGTVRSEEHTSELQSRLHLVCRLLLEKKKKHQTSVLRHNVNQLRNKKANSTYALTQSLRDT